MYFIPQKDILHILSFLNQGSDYVNFTNSIKYSKLRLEYHKFYFSKLLNFNFHKSIKTIKFIVVIKYFYEILKIKNNVLNFNLSCCENIKDVSKLSNVHTLYLSFCENIIDVLNLGNVYDLILIK